MQEWIWKVCKYEIWIYVLQYVLKQNSDRKQIDMSESILRKNVFPPNSDDYHAVLPCMYRDHDLLQQDQRAAVNKYTN